MTNATKTPYLFGLFTGLFNAADGSWVLMPQLRRFSSVAAWMLCFGLASYGVFALARSFKTFDVWTVLGLYVGTLLCGLGSFVLFLLIGDWWVGTKLFKELEETKEENQQLKKRIKELEQKDT